MNWFSRKKPTRTAVPADAASIKARLLADRAIFLGLPISDEVAKEFCESLEALVQRGREPITIYVNSPGGAVAASERIIDAMKNAPAEIITICLGLAAGTAASIFAGGHQRYMKPEATVLFVPATGGEQTTSRELADADTRLIVGLSRQTGLPAATFEHWMRTQVCLTARELVAGGFAHAILDAPLTDE